MKENKLQTVGAVAGYILSGGKNTRMEGQKKLFLHYGGATFCQRILHACDCLPAVYLSVDKKEPYEEAGLPMVEDRWREIGPIGGIASGRVSCEEDALLVMACDIPMIDTESVQRLLDTYRENTSVILAAEQNGRIHPLFGIYPKHVLPVAMQMIREGDYRMMHLLERAGYRTLELGKHSRALENINSTVDYRTLETGPRPFVFAVSGWKNSGKTTMITRLVPELVRRGYKVAVIKHDGHDFESDVPGTDSYRHQKAGAYGTAVFSDHRFLITKEYQGITERELFAAFPEADIILIEGLKNSPYPKYFCRYPEQPLISAEKLADEIEKYICTYSPGNSTDSVKNRSDR